MFLANRDETETRVKKINDFDEKLKVLNQLISDNMNLFTSENNNDSNASVDVEMKEEELHEFIEQNESE